VDADIEKFFDRVPHRPLKRRIKQIVEDRQLCRLINGWLEVGPHPGCLLRSRRGLLQGAVLSPFLCNVYLHPLDEAWRRANIPFVRFADDFLLMTERRSEAEAALDFTRNQLTRLELNLHPRKTRICRADQAVRFLGEPILRGRRLAKNVAKLLTAHDKQAEQTLPLAK
jgi:retron-type reverse transcriptase